MKCSLAVFRNFRARSSVKRNIKNLQRNLKLCQIYESHYCAGQIIQNMAPNYDGRKNVNNYSAHTETDSNQGQNREFSAKICDKSTMVVGCAKKL